MADTTSHSDLEAVQYLEQAGFHNKFKLPATESHGPLDVGYSDLGRQPTSNGGDTESPPVILFMPGIGACRVHGVFMGIVGEKMGVRILTVDRFGFGLSTEVEVSQRVSIWVELVPQLLAHLGIQHVSLVSHSAGTIYLLNTLHSCRDILSPTRPYAALLAPWVDVKCSDVKLLQPAQLIPNAWFGSCNKIMQTISSVATVSSSLAFAADWFQSGKKTSAEEVPEMSKNRLHWQREYISLRLLDAINDTMNGPMFSQNTIGLNSELRLCLKENNKTWGACEDFEDFCRELGRPERVRSRDTKLQIKILFAESDAMIGTTGQRYMEACWGNATKLDDVLEYSSATIDDTDHNSLLTRVAVLEEIIAHVAGIDIMHTVPQ